MNSSIYIAIASLALIGCESSDILVDHNFNETELKIIRHVVDEWYEATGSDDALVFLHEGYTFNNEIFEEDDWPGMVDGNATLQKISVNDPGYEYMTTEVFDTEIAGAAMEGRVVIAVQESYTNADGTIDGAWFHTLLLHEYGHFFGLMHGDGAIMVTGRGVLPCIDQESLDNFCKIHQTCLNPKPTCEE
jgi:hypothetical protein